MPEQETADVKTALVRRSFRKRVANAGRLAFYALSISLLSACVGAWIISFQKAQYFGADLFSLHRNGTVTILFQRYGRFDFKRGEAIVELGRISWNITPKAPFSHIRFSADHDPDPVLFESLLPQNCWHQFRYEIMRTSGDSNVRTYLGQTSITVAFPFWSAFAVLLTPFLVPGIRRAFHSVMERGRGFAPILKKQLDDTKPHVPHLSRERR